MGIKDVDDSLLIPNYDVLTRIVIDNVNDNSLIISKIINRWKNHKNLIKKKMNVGIITFHNDYKRKFEKEIKEINNDDISLYTADSSQGEEFTTVILYIDLNLDREIGFLKDYHRINVAVSRAREQLIIVETREFINKYNDFKAEQAYFKFRTFIDNIHLIPERGVLDE